MRTHRVCFLVLVLLSSAALGRAENKVVDKFLPDTTAGQEVKIAGVFEGDGTWHATLAYLGTPEKTLPTLPAKVSEDKKSLSFTLPTDLKDGRYRVTLTLEGAAGILSTLTVPGDLRIPAPPELRVTVTTVQPVSPDPGPYPNPRHGNHYDFEIAGTNFSPNLKNNIVEINGVPIPLMYDDPNDRSLPPCDLEYKTPCLKAAAGNETRKLVVYGYSPPGFSHPLEVSVRVGDSVAKAPTPIVFSEISKTQLKIYAVGAFLALVLILWGLVRTGIKTGKINGEKYGSLRAFLIDKETNSYSLSKFQLTLFTLVTVFGYIYVFVCRLFVQWKFELPPVPEGLPTMMAVSLGTTVVAAGIGSKIGGKGAGPESPSLADFITSGGVVLPERFQFFLWTIVSSVGVLALILASDPVTVTELPKLPDGMLYLMGLSSAGYLGGKLARGPGPSIKSIDAQVAADRKSMTVVLTGDNLSKDATFELDNERIPAAQVVLVCNTPEAQDPKLCSKLTVTFKNVAERLFDQPHTLSIINPDSQRAELKYGATIESVNPVEGEPRKFLVTGTNFKDPSTAQWYDAANSTNPIPIEGEHVTKKSDMELIVTLGGDAAPAKISIIGPNGLKTTFDVLLQKQVDTPAPPVAPPVDPPAGPPVDPSAGPPVDPPVDPPAGQPVDPPAGPPVDLPAGPPVDPPVDPPVNPPAEEISGESISTDESQSDDGEDETVEDTGNPERKGKP
jgi:hypothetical protein